MSERVSRRGSDKRQKTVIKTLRFTPDESEVIAKQAEAVGLTPSAFIRNAALNKKITPKTDVDFLNELLRLGRLQKHLFVEGKRTGDKDYSTVLVAITELSRTLREKLLSNE